MHRPTHSICVFASSSEKLDAAYYTLAEELGLAIAKAGAEMIFGGGTIGLMGAAARGAQKGGGTVIGVIPEKLHRPGVAFSGCAKLVVTETMHARKQTMESLSSAFVALPGGFGTLEELLEVITLKQLGYHNKPIVLLNKGGFYNPLLEQFELLFSTGFSHAAYRGLFSIAESAAQAIEQVLHYMPDDMPDKIVETLRA